MFKFIKFRLEILIELIGRHFFFFLNLRSLLMLIIFFFEKYCRASDWNLDSPDWTCRLRLISKGDDCYIKLEEKSTGHFFGLCPIDKYPGPAVEPVADSSRYFVLRLVNESNNRNAFIGIGFADRGDSFDLNVTLQDHFKFVITFFNFYLN